MITNYEDLRFDNRAISRMQVKVKLSLHLTNHHVIKTYWGTGVIAPHILNLRTKMWVSCQVVSFTSRNPCPGKENPSTHWIGGWVSSRADLDMVVRRKSTSPCRESNPGRPACSLVSILPQLRRLSICRCSRNIVLCFVIFLPASCSGGGGGGGAPLAQ
jgi:hypothetical protein